MLKFMKQMYYQVRDLAVCGERDVVIGWLFFDFDWLFEHPWPTTRFTQLGQMRENDEKNANLALNSFKADKRHGIMIDFYERDL